MWRIGSVLGCIPIVLVWIAVIIAIIPVALIMTVIGIVGGNSARGEYSTIGK